MNLALDTNCWNHPELQASPEHSKLAPIPEEKDEQGNFPAMNVTEPQDPVSWLIFSLLGHVYIVANRKKMFTSQQYMVFYTRTTGARTLHAG
jgi:hypothetical protein